MAEKLERLALHRIDLTAGAVLERGCVYVAPLLEHLALSSRIAGLANPKSSTGRLDIFTRLLIDRAAEFERVPAGYHGPLYIEISPRTFGIVVRTGDRLNQLRLRRGAVRYSDAALRRLHAEVGLIDRPVDEGDISRGLPLTV